VSDWNRIIIGKAWLTMAESGQQQGLICRVGEIGTSANDCPRLRHYSGHLSNGHLSSRKILPWKATKASKIPIWWRLSPQPRA